MAGQKSKAGQVEKSGSGTRKREHVVPEFDIAMWGYDREQVERCLEDMTARLEQALGQLDTVEVLQSQLCEAHVEIDQLRLASEDRSAVEDRLSKLMLAAELLRNQAVQDAEAIRARARAEVTQGASTT